MDHGLNFFNVNGISDGCFLISRDIDKLVFDREFMYSDIVVLIPETESYRLRLKNLLKIYGIPFFFNCVENIYNNNLVNLVISILDILIDFKTDNIMRFLKSGFSNFSEKEIWIFQNYYSISDVMSKSFENHFELNCSDKKILIEIKEKILSFFYDIKKKAEKNGICKTIFNLIKFLEIEKKIMLIKNLDIKHKQNQIISLIISILNENNLRYSYLEFKDIFLKNIEFSNILEKNTEDTVFVTSLSKDLDNYKVAFIFDMLENFRDINVQKKNIILYKNNVEGNSAFSKDYSHSLNKFFYLNKNLDFENIKDLDRIFDKKIFLSISKIEKFYLCPFMYFCEYVLNIKSIKLNNDFFEYGSLVHFVLEKFFSQKIENSELEIKILNLIKFYISSKVENNVSKFSHIIAKCFNNLVFSIKKLIELSTKSKFKPNDFEFKFSQCMEFHKIKLSVILEGKIDRIDVFKDKNYFLRVIDYKSGNKKFNLVEIMNGINIQLIVYLIVLKFNEKYKKFKPTGALYFSTKKPTINKLINESNESLNNRLSKLTFMQGFTIDSEPLNTEINIDQLTEEEMNVILEYSKFLISNMVEKLMNADITPKPVVISNCKTSCDICDYKNMCQKDINIKILETKLKKEEVIQNMIAAIGSKIKFLRIKHNK